MKRKYIRFIAEEFNFDNFIKEVSVNFKLNTIYGVFIRISSHDFTIFRMCGSQFIWKVGFEHDLDYYKKIFNLFEMKIDMVSSLYPDSFFGEVESIELIYYEVNKPKNLIFDNQKDYQDVKKEVIKHNENWGKIRKIFGNNLLPLTMNKEYYGNLIVGKYKLELFNLIVSNNKGINWGDIILDNIDLFIYVGNAKYKYIICSYEQSPGIYIRYLFDYNMGILINQISDMFINKNEFCRRVNNLSIRVFDGKIKLLYINRKLEKIDFNYRGDLSFNNKIGSFDLETFMDGDISRVYALGFKTNYINNDGISDNTSLYFIDNEVKMNNPDLRDIGVDKLNYKGISYIKVIGYKQLILKCINDMLNIKYNNYTFYSHNMGRYDIIFILNILLEYNDYIKKEFYILKPIMRDNRIIKLDIKINRKIKISLVDSFNLLGLSLRSLIEIFNLSDTKDLFPYSFVKLDTLNYIGKVPSKKYFDMHISNDNYIEYKNKFNVWDLKYESLKYLNQDINSLHLIMDKFNIFIFNKFNIRLSDCSTITRLALNILKYNYSENLVIPQINQAYLFNFLREGYYGGITEVYKPYGKDLVYLDINSLYPYIGLSDMPGLDCRYVYSLNNGDINIENKLGFYYARIKTSDLYLGLLPVRKNGQLIFPNGEFEGVWSSDELNFAKKNGYEIEIMYGYEFNSISSGFKDYIQNIFNLKKVAKGYFKFIYKSLLNNLLGRFGLNMIKPITQIVNEKDKDYIMFTKKVFNLVSLFDNKYFITYNPLLDKEICDNNNVSFQGALKREFNNKSENSLPIFKDISIVISAYINAKARVFMSKIKLDILKLGGSIYYSDTDSIVISKSDLNNLNISKYLNIGDNIGDFKIEYYIKEGYFISNKTYCLVLDNNEVIIRSKGVISNSLSLDDFKNMYLLHQNSQGFKKESIIDLSNGSVNIRDKKISLNFDSYEKRDKIFDSNNIWVDTKPLRLDKK